MFFIFFIHKFKPFFSYTPVHRQKVKLRNDIAFNLVSLAKQEKATVKQEFSCSTVLKGRVFYLFVYSFFVSIISNITDVLSIFSIRDKLYFFLFFSLSTTDFSKLQDFSSVIWKVLCNFCLLMECKHFATPESVQLVSACKFSFSLK